MHWEGPCSSLLYLALLKLWDEDAEDLTLHLQPFASLQVVPAIEVATEDARTVHVKQGVIPNSELEGEIEELAFEAPLLVHS